MDITNEAIIDEWSEFCNEDLTAFGDEGDDARKDLIEPNILSSCSVLNDSLTELFYSKVIIFQPFKIYIV